MVQITIDTEQCIGCKWCTIMCEEGVLYLIDEHHAGVDDLEKCTGCMVCEEECLEGAIKVQQM